MSECADPYMFLGIGAGAGVAVTVIVTVIIICVRRRMQRKRESRGDVEEPTRAAEPERSRESLELAEQRVAQERAAARQQQQQLASSTGSSSGNGSSGNRTGAAIRPRSIAFEATPVLALEGYERFWSTLPAGATIDSRLARAYGEEELIQMLSVERIHCLASGLQDGVIRLYVYAQVQPNGEYVLAELLHNTQARHLQGTVKTNQAEAAQTFAKIVRQVVN